MRPIHYRKLIIDAVKASEGRTLDMIIAHLADAERAKQILRAMGYGGPEMSASATAALVPPALKSII